MKDVNFTELQVSLQSFKALGNNLSRIVRLAEALEPLTSLDQAFRDAKQRVDATRAEETKAKASLAELQTAIVTAEARKVELEGPIKETEERLERLRAEERRLAGVVTERQAIEKELTEKRAALAEVERKFGEFRRAVA